MLQNQNSPFKSKVAFEQFEEPCDGELIRVRYKVGGEPITRYYDNCKEAEAGLVALQEAGREIVEARYFQQTSVLRTGQ